MGDAFSPEELLEFHRRLIAGDRLAPEAFARRFLSYFIAETSRKFPRKHGHHAHDGAIDAILDFCAHPDRVDPSREASLEACILKAAWCNATNLIVGEDRLKKREWQVGKKNSEISVAFDPVARKIKQEENRRQATDLAEILAALNDMDREIYKLQLQGTRATGAFAKILHIEHLPLKQQRSEVKRHKDRIREFLKRKGLLL